MLNLSKEFEIKDAYLNELDVSHRMQFFIHSHFWKKKKIFSFSQERSVRQTEVLNYFVRPNVAVLWTVCASTTLNGVCNGPRREGRDERYSLKIYVIDLWSKYSNCLNMFAQHGNKIQAADIWLWKYSKFVSSYYRNCPRV
jgi:hypothetical protein